MNIIILGPPGSGKGTQASLISKKLNLYYFEAGDFARELAKSSERIRNIVEQGDLIPENEMTGYVNKFLERSVPSGKNILFDGYPRFVSQYEDLCNWLKKRESKIDMVIFLNIKDNIVINRLSSRRMCQKCSASYNLITNPPRKNNICNECGGKLIQRNDDKPAAISERLKAYRANVEPLIKFLREKEILFEVNAEKTISSITREILEEIEKEGPYA